MLRFIFKGGGVRQIKWDWKDKEHDAFHWPAEQKLDCACNVASSMNQAAAALQVERNELLEKLDLAIKEREAAEKLREIDSVTLVEVITKGNADRQEYAQELQQLQVRVKQQDVIIKDLRSDIDGR